MRNSPPCRPGLARGASRNLVTATRREESLHPRCRSQSPPCPQRTSRPVVSTNLADLSAGSIPSVVFTQFSGGPGTLAISVRGVGSPTNDAGHDRADGARVHRRHLPRSRAGPWSRPRSNPSAWKSCAVRRASCSAAMPKAAWCSTSRASRRVNLSSRAARRTVTTTTSATSCRSTCRRLPASARSSAASSTSTIRTPRCPTVTLSRGAEPPGPNHGHLELDTKGFRGAVRWQNEGGFTADYTYDYSDSFMTEGYLTGSTWTSSAPAFSLQAPGDDFLDTTTNACSTSGSTSRPPATT